MFVAILKRAFYKVRKQKERENYRRACEEACCGDNKRRVLQISFLRVSFPEGASLKESQAILLRLHAIEDCTSVISTWYCFSSIAEVSPSFIGSMLTS